MNHLNTASINYNKLAKAMSWDYLNIEVLTGATILEKKTSRHSLKLKKEDFDAISDELWELFSETSLEKGGISRKSGTWNYWHEPGVYIECKVLEFYFGQDVRLIKIKEVELAHSQAENIRLRASFYDVETFESSVISKHRVIERDGWLDVPINSLELLCPSFVFAVKNAEVLGLSEYQIIENIGQYWNKVDAKLQLPAIDPIP